MFPDSEIAQKFQLGKTKCAYPVNYGMGPFCKRSICKEYCTSPSFSVSFDESMNRVLRNEQMDVQVCCWDVSTSVASTHYLNL